MDEARRVLDRLGRIDRLRKAQAKPAVILREIRALLAEGEAWREAEHAVVRTDAANGRPPAGRRTTAGADRSMTETGRSPTEVREDPADEPGTEPIRRAAVALAQLDTSLAGGAADAREREVMPERPAL